jgi:hypothetical protein
MLKLINKTIYSFKTEGMTNTLTKIIRYSQGIIKIKKFNKNILALNNTEDRFTEIYKRNYWGNKESVSGDGSTFEYTTELRSELPIIFKKFSIKTIFDAPCGDFNWMRYVLKENDLNYIGGDIVAPLIESLNENFRDSKTFFIHIDLIQEKFPKSDLMICRDCLFHLSFQDTKLLLENFIDSKTPYLLTTTHIFTERIKNKDIKTGDFRPIDLFSEPYHFPKDVIYRIEDWKAPEQKREMCLWTRDQIIDAVKNFN